jgi:hypothetical protein
VRGGYRWRSWLTFLRYDWRLQTGKESAITIFLYNTA